MVNKNVASLQEINVYNQMNSILKEKLHFGLLSGRKETLEVKRAKDSSVPILISFDSFMTAQLHTDILEDLNVSYYCLQYIKFILVFIQVRY